MFGTANRTGNAEFSDNKVSPKEAVAIKLIKENGPKLAKEHPEIATDYENGMIYTKLVDKYNVLDYGVTPEIARGIVGHALKILLTEEQRDAIRKRTWTRIGNTHKANGTGAFSVSDERRREMGRKLGRMMYENKRGIHAFTTEQRREIGSKVGRAMFKSKKGIHSLTTEQLQEIGRSTYERGVGIHSQTLEQRSELGKRNGRATFEKGVGIHGLTTEQLQETGRRNYENGVGIHGYSEEEKLRIKRLGAKARGNIPYVTTAVEVLTGLNEKDYCIYLSKQLDYQHKNGVKNVIGKPDAAKIADRLNEVFHSGKEIRKPAAIRNMLYKERRKKKSSKIVPSVPTP